MKKIGFATSKDLPLGIEDDLLAAPYLKEAGIDVVPVVWDKPGDISELDAVIIRSCWDYHRRAEDFIHFVRLIDQKGIKLFNPLATIEWNFHKRYLLELESLDVLIPQTLIIDKDDPLPGDELFRLSDALVVKPAVSLNGEDTYCIHDNNDEGTLQKTVSGLLERGEVLIQEFISEIQTNGEYSFIFFNRKFSHALRKVPAQGEFRIHVEYGGSRLEFTPTSDQIKVAESILAKVEGDLLYARVDVVEREGELYLLELELLDPMLYLGYAPGAAQNFAKAIAENLK